MRTIKTFLACFIVVYGMAACVTSESQNPSPNSPFPKETATKVYTTQRSTEYQTPTIEPTSIFKPEDTYLFLDDVISSNDDCKFPCKTRIFPGQTTVFEAKSILLPLLSIAKPESYFDDNIGSIYITYSKDTLETQINIAFVHLPNNNDNIVSYLELDMKTFQKVGEGSYKEIYDSSSYQELISGYSLQGIYSTYGLPSSIFTRLENNVGEDTAPDYFYFWTLYPEQGIYLRYRTPIIVTSDQVEVCPKKSFVTVWFLPKNRPQDHGAILSVANTEWNNLYSSPGSLMPINNAFNISTFEFYESIAKTPEQCFKTNLSVWPPP